MLINHMILLLMSWPLARSIEDKKPPDDTIDQIAEASANQRVSFNNGNNHPLNSKESTRSPLTARSKIHYENSNGFVPMSRVDGIVVETSKIPETNSSKIEVQEDEKSLDPNGGKLELIENDPAYSTEARMFLSLGGPSADRRSFDTRDGQSEFEILKVNKETPAVANYHEFYENVQNNLNRNRGGTQTRYGESEGRTSVQNKRTKDRIKKIEKYLTNFQSTVDRENGDPYEQYYHNYPAGKSLMTSGQKEIFEPEKVHPVYREGSASAGYDVYDETPLRQRTSSSVGSSYDDAAGNSRQKYPTAPMKNRHSKPVVVIEPSNYKLDVKYDNQQVSGKVSSSDHRRSQKNRKESPQIEISGQYDDESRVNREDRYGQSDDRSEDVDDYTEDDGDYLEITEKPRRIHKNKRRPYSIENSRRLPKEHRGHVTDSLEPDESRKNNSPSRSKIHRSKAKPSYWIDDDREANSEEDPDGQTKIRPIVVTSKPSEKMPKQSSKSKGVTNWSQVAPNIEVSHSNGFEISQIDKPKLLVPVNLNLLPLSNFDHSTALGNSQGFDFSNVQNFITATPLVSSQSPAVSTSPTVSNSDQGHSANSPKNIQNLLNNNYGLSTAVPDIVVGQNTYENPVQTVLLPQMNVENKYASNLRPHYLPSTVAPMFAVTQTLNSNLRNIGPTMTSIPLQSIQSTSSPPNVNPISHQNIQHLVGNPTLSPTVSQLLLPQPTLQSFPLLHSPYNPHSSYNILVNPNGLHGQNVVQHGNVNSQSGTVQESSQSTSTPQPITISSNNVQPVDTQARKSVQSTNNGQFVTTASFSVDNVKPEQSNVPNDNKYYLPSGNQNFANPNDNNHLHENENNEQARSQRPNNYYQVYRDDNDSDGKTKTYVQTAHMMPAIIHHGNGIPINFNNQHYANIGGNLQGQQSILNPSFIAHRPRDQNQQILKAANDIFENTWKQLQQLQTTDNLARRPYQNVYRVNDNVGSTSNANVNTVNTLLGINQVNSAKAHLPNLPTQNVEIVNPNIKPSPVDFTLLNPYETLSHYPAAVLTTPIPIFSTTAGFLAPRPVFASTTASPINLQNYVDQLTQMGAHSHRVNNIESRPVATNHQDNQRQVFNPINFVPNSDLVKSQSMLNNKNVDHLPSQLNLVPVIPGGNFFKSSQGAQTELVQKPRLSSDLQKYADEMFKESLKTIYSTHKWNNDRKFRGNYSLAELNDLMKLKSELQRFKVSMSDQKSTGKDVLEAHHSETKVRTAEPSGRPTKKPELSIADIEQIFKSDFKLNLPSSSESYNHGNHHKNRPVQNHGSSRPGSTSDHSTEFKGTIRLSDYLTPPKPNSFVSKSPFIDSSKPGKKRPGSNSARYNSGTGNSRPLPRPSSLVSRPPSSLDVSASNHFESGLKVDSHHRHEKHHPRLGHYTRDNNNNYDYRNYPTFTTTLSPDTDMIKTSSSEQLSKTDYYDINHPRMHNLLGLLMKNKQLPKGSTQSLFRDDDELRQYFDNENRRIHSEFHNDNTMSIQKNSDTPINMEPPAPPSNLSLIRYYPTRGGV